MIPPQYDAPERVVQLCQELEAATKLKKEGRSRKFVNTVSNTSQAITSWKFNEWDYGKSHKVKLPIDARGLFTINDSTIVVRGYDKFFNVGELKITTREDMLENTKGPYDVTLKENGCIILIGGLSTGELVVCSKHSTGARDNLTTNHALEGEAQVIRQLQRMNKSPQELAKFLFDHNLTAVAELCDDSFEEHVLPYSKDQAGLYLHGLNYNTIVFSTVPIDQVNEFAKEWGFHTIESLRYDDFGALFEFLDECAKTGTYNGKEVEGFVIRCKSSESRDFFFKFKFEQPYLLYRQFREVTKQYLLADKPVSLIRLKKNKYITRQYLQFVEQLFKEQPALKESFANGKGIIKTRELFLEHINESQGINLLNIDKLHEGMENLKVTDTEGKTKLVVIPVATIACGKTTVFQTLINLFPQWSHVQNDNISKSAKVKLAELCIKQLQIKPVVLVDRNNSEYRERSQLFRDFDSKRSKYIDEDVDFQYICINFIDNVDKKELWDITLDRMKARGDNHQSIKFNTDENLAVKVMKGFISRFQPVQTTKEPDSGFDLVINLKLHRHDSSKENVKTIIEQIAAKYPSVIEKVPSDDEIDVAFQAALAYQPTFVKVMSKPKDPSYYGVAVEVPTLMEYINSVAAEHQQWNELQKLDRVQKEFHVTLGHSGSASSAALKQKWKKLVKCLPAKYEQVKKNPLEFYADLQLGSVVIAKDRLVCVTANALKFYDKDLKPIELETLNKHLHITIGTFAPKIRPVESNTILGLLHAKVQKLTPGKYEVDGTDVEVLGSTRVLAKQQIFAFF
ncbi:tRNA ligase [Suhomyces tanzawaensis NRRL Y-17324]|uniref:tRNA ligase n=1 Tax=Suhomyces tanzawaensis NRRL Y-17324 TaxID=984487 RepID=A0A1E4SRZ5_9ASCO|nr:tRNA ligase [Suhomyces tanzawaensis NRRL Y-17324]ODV82286.1 tRNA ligase [Suhomyces tanzawaensis NRRL Y-17324]